MSDETGTTDYDAWLLRNPPHPGHAILDGCLNGMGVSEAAAKLGVSRATLSRVLNGSAGISVLLALKLEAQDWSKADVWIRLQGAYDLAQGRKRNRQWPVEDKARPSA